MLAVLVLAGGGGGVVIQIYVNLWSVYLSESIL